MNSWPGLGKRSSPSSVSSVKKAPFVFCGPNNRWFPGDSNLSGGIDQGRTEAANAVDQAKRKRLLACPDLSRREWLDLLVGGVAADGDVVDELGVHIVDERLEVGLLLRSQVAAGVAGDP